MTRRRWIADEFNAGRAALIGGHAAHLARTLRARIGQQFEIACGDQVRQGTVSSVSDERVEFSLGELVTSSSVVPITLLLSVVKFDRMEWAIEKCTELNVTTIIPLIARRTEKHLAAAVEKRVERWRRIARESAEQSRRLAPPEIFNPNKLEHLIGSTDASTRIVLAEDERQLMLAEVLGTQPDIGSLSLAVGPEGGWTEDEIHTFVRANWNTASLGDTILRAETAAIAALAIARAML